MDLDGGRRSLQILDALLFWRGGGRIVKKSQLVRPPRAIANAQIANAQIAVKQSTCQATYMHKPLVFAPAGSEVLARRVHYPAGSTVNNEMAASAAYHVNTVVVGAGAVGLAAARAIAATGRETIILEREKSIGQGTSSRNSEVIHAGIYYPPQLQPLKARLCVRGKELLYSYCSDHNIPHQRIGKLIVATDESQLKTNLPAIMERANTSGVTDLHLLSKDEVKDMEAEVVCHGAIFSPSTPR